MCKDFFIRWCFSGLHPQFFDFWMALIWFGVSVSGVAGWTMVSAFSGQKIPPTDTQTVNDEINQTKISKCRQVSIDR
ncbi:TPA: hypothetical protein J1Z51_001547 [Escherichia coli]|uniref:hypothetical protein n=1 Tax=Escherichia coli TaxID=562 RepID=UPI0015E98479|nr:hypothetical protein [Escherichia marmotae]QML63168.1 hypothetical protein HVX30_03175 [Escherichia coli]HAP0275425.1 hypothetical protein [Escherichia coli]HBA7807762.1 hypothetical protein [Escherichia coli]HBA9669357.1 hypothetical protein [Escherichia coli]